MQTAREESSIIIFGENLLRPERVTGKKRPEAGSQQRHSTHPLVGKAEIQHSTELAVKLHLIIIYSLSGEYNSCMLFLPFHVEDSKKRGSPLLSSQKSPQLLIKNITGGC